MSLNNLNQNYQNFNRQNNELNLKKDTAADEELFASCNIFFQNGDYENFLSTVSKVSNKIEKDFFIERKIPEILEGDCLIPEQIKWALKFSEAIYFDNIRDNQLNVIGTHLLKAKKINFINEAYPLFRLHNIIQDIAGRIKEDIIADFLLISYVDKLSKEASCYTNLYRAFYTINWIEDEKKRKNALKLVGKQAKKWDVHIKTIKSRLIYWENLKFDFN